MIIGERVRLRAMERQDLPRYVAWLNDPEVIQGLQIHYPLSQAQEEHWFENVLKKPVDEQPVAIEVLHEDTWKMVGNCGFFNIDWRCRSAEVGIFIGDKAVWNQGYGTQAMRLMLKHGFDNLNLNRIQLDVYETNPRAIRAYEKAGYTLEGRKRQAMVKGGMYIDVLIMSILRSEWIEQNR